MAYSYSPFLQSHENSHDPLREAEQTVGRNDVMRRISSTYDSVVLGEKAKQDLLEPELLDLIRNHLLSIRTISDEQGQPPVCIIGGGSYFQSKGQELLGLSHMSRRTFEQDRSDIDLCYPCIPGSDYSPEQYRTNAAGVGGLGITALRKISIYEDRAKGMKIDGSVYSWRDRRVATKDELLATYFIRVPNSGLMLFELDDDDQVCVNYVWQDADLFDSGFTDAYEVRISGVRALQVALQSVFQHGASQELPLQIAGVLRQQEYNNFLPYLLTGLTDEGRAYLFDVTPHGKEVRRLIQDKDLARADTVRLAAISVSQEMSRLLGEYAGEYDGHILVKNLLSTGLLQASLQASRILQETKTDLLGHVIDLFINACGEGLQQDDVEMINLMPQIETHLLVFIQDTGATGLRPAKTEINWAGQVEQQESTYSAYAELSKLLERIPPDIFQHQGNQVVIRDYPKSSPLSLTLPVQVDYNSQPSIAQQNELLRSCQTIIRFYDSSLGGGNPSPTTVTV